MNALTLHLPYYKLYKNHYLLPHESEYCDEKHVLENYEFNYEPDPKVDPGSFGTYNPGPRDVYKRAEDAMRYCMIGILNYR